MQSADPSVENSRRRLYHLGRAQLARSISFWGGWGLGPCCLCAIRHAARSVDSGPRAYRRSVQSQRATTRIHIVCCVAVRASRQSCVLGLGRGPGAVACRDSGVLGVGLLSLSTTPRPHCLSWCSFWAVRAGVVYTVVGKNITINIQQLALPSYASGLWLRFAFYTRQWALLALLCLGVVLIKFSLAWQHHLRHKIGHHILSPIFE